MKLTDSVLVESKAARDQGVFDIAAKNSEDRILSKVKSVFFSLWEGNSYMTTEQVATYYDVSEDVIRQNLKRHREEFESDGIRRIEGEDLARLRDTMSRSRARYITLYSSRAVIRMGFTLQGSPVAAQVRTAALNVLQCVGELISSEQILGSLIAGEPHYSSLISGSQLKVSAPLESYYDSIKKSLKSLYTDGGIQGLTKQDIRGRLAELSTYSQGWKLTTQGELQYQLHSKRAKCPDLVSQVFPVNVDGEQKKSVFMFQLEDLVVRPENIEDCIGRQYVRRAQQALGVDYAYIFLVSPFGATPDAQISIQSDLPPDLKGFIGILTVKELAEFLRDQAWKERTVSLVKGEMNKRFHKLLDYNIPTDPLSVLLGLRF